MRHLVLQWQHEMASYWVNSPGGLSFPGGGDQVAGPGIYTGCFWAKLRLKAMLYLGVLKVGFQGKHSVVQATAVVVSWMLLQRCRSC